MRFDHMVKPFSFMTTTTEVEQKILEAARAEFEMTGFAGARMQEIANKAEISKASLHYYFRSKENLFQRIFDEAIDEYMPIVQTWSDDSLDWENKVRRFTDELIGFIKNGKMLFLIREINRNPELLTQRLKNKKKQNLLVAYFEDLAAKGVIRKIDARLIYIFLNSLCCFPFINKEMFQKVLRTNTKEYDELMQSYGKSASEFFINALKK